MSAEEKSPLDAEAVEALISKHAEALAEACKEEARKAAEAAIAEALRKQAEASKGEAESGIKKAIDGARDAVKTESAALLAKMEDFVNKAIKGRAHGKGLAGSLDEHANQPPKLQFGMVAVPPYFKELAAAAEKKKSFDGAVKQGGLS